MKKKVNKSLVLTTPLILTKSPLSQKQLLHILQRTPKNHIYHRPGKGGGEFDYVTGTYIKKVLNYTFGFQWDFEIKEHGEKGNMAWVLGRLTIKDDKGKPRIIKEQFGRADVKQKKTGGDLDFGNDLKAAATDALKKCASELGIASDIYGKNEFKEIQQVDRGFIPPVEENAKIAQKNEKSSIRVNELRGMLKGTTDSEKILNLKKRSGIVLSDFQIPEKHAGIIIAELLNKETK